MFDHGIDFIASIATESGNYETFFPNGVSAVFLEETPTCCGGTTVTLDSIGFVLLLCVILDATFPETKNTGF